MITKLLDVMALMPTLKKKEAWVNIREDITDVVLQVKCVKPSIAPL